MQPNQKPPAVHPRQADIECDKAEVLVRRNREPFLTARGNDDAKSFSFEQQSKHFGTFSVVFDDERNVLLGARLGLLLRL